MGKRIRLVKGDAFHIAFCNLTLPVMEDENYEIKEDDVLIFLLKRRNRRPIIKKKYPEEIEREENDFIVNLSARETARLPCLLYQAQIVFDQGGTGERVYTLIDRELEVVAK